jgi:hypothetical protein
MKYRITFAIGQKFTSAGRPIDQIEAKRNIAYRYLAEQFGGFTATLGHGGWIDSAGRLILESSLEITSYVCESLLPNVETSAEFLRSLFEQESVMVARETAHLSFTSAEQAEQSLTAVA